MPTQTKTALDATLSRVALSTLIASAVRPALLAVGANDAAAHLAGLDSTPSGAVLLNKLLAARTLVRSRVARLDVLDANRLGALVAARCLVEAAYELAVSLQDVGAGR